MYWPVTIIHAFSHRAYGSNLDTYLRLSKVQPHHPNGTTQHVSSKHTGSAAHRQTSPSTYDYFI